MNKKHIAYATGAVLALGGLVAASRLEDKFIKANKQPTGQELMESCVRTRDRVEKVIGETGNREARAQQAECEANWDKCNNGDNSQICKIEGFPFLGRSLSPVSESAGIGSYQLQEWGNRCVREATSCLNDIPVTIAENNR